MTTVAENPTRRGPRTRADALRNRELIVTAAREIFVEFGPEAPLDEIARRAGVGNATLYRNFADRSALIHEVLLSVMIRTADHAEAFAALEPDPFTALRRFAHAAVDERVGALCGMLVGGVDQHDPIVKAHGERLESAVEGLMEKARRAGQLRTDVTVGDLVVALSQLTRPLPGMGCLDTDGVAHRHLQLFLDGLRSAAPSELPGASTTLENLGS
ncbi:TetR/AcrR family transcriptional regulator [Streptomyces polygonati]|uniref:TetR/AcrR family transcriptional regulator n=1 Tax=Streptomyces polygonati TaxID=1617087 RepID=A0ABV8HID4_9ACTN